MKFIHPILSCAEAQELERLLLNGDEGREWTAMNKAGRSLGIRVVDDFGEVGYFPECGRILVLAGKGHNGGDAILAADEILKVKTKAKVTVVLVLGDRGLKPLVRRSLDLLLRNGGEQVEVLSWRDNAVERLDKVEWDICLDGILGMQFQPPLKGSVEPCVRWANERCRARLRAAVDLPTGVGDQCSGVRFRADFTYATGILKRPLLESDCGENVGRIRYLDIGFFEGDIEKNTGDHVLLSKILHPISEFRPSNSDKRSFGHLYLVGGSRMMPGAIQMAVKAAVKSGVGLVTAFVPKSVAAHFAAIIPEAMWVPMPETKEGGLGLNGIEKIKEMIDRASALVVGPGMGKEKETQELITRIASETTVKLGIDADGLQSEVIKALGKRPMGAGEVVITPHLGEFRRIAEGKVNTEKKLDLSSFSFRHNVITVLKGRITRISDGDRTIHSFFGGPLLARGGSGDLLTGLVGSMLARPDAGGLTAACQAVALHGLACDQLVRRRGAEAIRTTDLLEFLGAAIRCC